MTRRAITVAELRTLLQHDPATGRLYWLPRPFDKRWSAQYAGREALRTIGENGYRMGSVHKRNFYAHRVIWALHYGEWPASWIVHANGDRADNRIENLRHVEANPAANLPPVRRRISTQWQANPIAAQ
jgi:hypothetical protein